MHNLFNSLWKVVGNVKFYCDDAGEFILEQYSRDIKYDVVIMAPPRKGSDDKFLNVLLETHPKKIVYVSCAPATLARDLKKLSRDYEIKTVTTVDMFPKYDTCGEIVLLCLKDAKKSKIHWNHVFWTIFRHFFFNIDVDGSSEKTIKTT